MEEVEGRPTAAGDALTYSYACHRALLLHCGRGDGASSHTDTGREAAGEGGRLGNEGGHRLSVRKVVPTLTSR
jgi:hypothetical protein